MIYLLFILFQVKHFIFDYPLQTDWMLKKASPLFREWVGPLFVHSSPHAFGTVIICALFGAPELIFPLGTLDFASHFVIDRVKASPYLLGRYKSNSRYFWWGLGLDQMLHHSVSVLLVYLLLEYR